MHQLSSVLSGKGREARAMPAKAGLQAGEGRTAFQSPGPWETLARCPLPLLPPGRPVVPRLPAALLGQAGGTAAVPPGGRHRPPSAHPLARGSGGPGPLHNSSFQRKKQKDTKGISLEMCFQTVGTTNYTTRVTFLASLRGRTFAGVVASCVKSAILFLLFK